MGNDGWRKRKEKRGYNHKSNSSFGRLKRTNEETKHRRCGNIRKHCLICDEGVALNEEKIKRMKQHQSYKTNCRHLHKLLLPSIVVVDNLLLGLKSYHFGAISLR